MSKATSASERVSAAEKALAHFDAGKARGHSFDPTTPQMLADALRAMVESAETAETPESIVARIERGFNERHGFTLASIDGFGTRKMIAEMLEKAVRAGIQAAWESWEPDDYAEANGAPLVVSAPTHGARTGVVERTVADLVGVINGYVADGYKLEELVIEGVTA